MNPERYDLLLPARLRASQIITAAMILGVVIFLGVALFIVQVQRGGQPLQGGGNLPVVSLIAAWFLVQDALLAGLIPGMMKRNALRRIAAGTWQVPPGGQASDYADDVGKLMAVRQTTLIITLALFEGAAMLGIMAYMLEGELLTLGVPLVALGVMLANFPTQDRLRLWLQEQEDRVADLRRAAELGV